MARVLIPFSKLENGERAVRRLLREPREPRLTVELLAIVDPLTPGKVMVFVSPAKAEAQARAAASSWLDRLQRILTDACVPWRSSVAVGPVRAILRRERGRADIDRVLLGARDGDPLRRLRRQFVAHLMNIPVISVT